MNPLEENLQMAKMRHHKTDVSDAHELSKTHFKMERETTYIQREEAKVITLLEAAENSYPRLSPQIFVVIKH